MSKRFAVGEMVYDLWWPWRLGRVVDAGAVFVSVLYGIDDVWKHDRAHQQFLREASK